MLERAHIVALSTQRLSEAVVHALQGSLNAFMALGRPAWRQVRSALQSLLTDAAGMLADPTVQQRAVVPMVRRIFLLKLCLQ